MWQIADSADGKHRLDDPDNPRKVPDGLGGLNSSVAILIDGHPQISEVDTQRPMGATKIWRERRDSNPRPPA
jgi:hypothetical protein